MAVTTALTGIYKFRDDFVGYRSITGTPEQGTGWKATTGGSGSPTARGLDGADSGALRLALDSTSAAQWITLTHGDTKSFAVGGVNTEGSLRSFQVKVNYATLPDSTNYAAFAGMGGNYSGSLTAGLPTTVARVGFEIVGTEIYVRCYDGTTDSGQVDTGIAIQAGVPMVLEVNLDQPTNIKFFASIPSNYGAMRQVCLTNGTTFSLVGQEGNSFQPYVHHGKINGVSTTTADLDVISINGERL